MEEEGQKRPVEKLRIQYFKPENYKPIYVSGAYGGVTPRGDLLCHFFYEYGDIPVEERGPVVEGKYQVEQIEKFDRVEHEPNEFVLRRDVRVGLIIPIHQVRIIAEWMLRKVEDIEEVPLVEKKEKKVG